MAYEPTEWKCGDTITAEKMNKIEAELQTLSESGGGGTDYYLIEFHTDPETGDSHLSIIPNGNYSEEIWIDSSTVDKLPLLYQIFTQEKWIPLGWLTWQINGIDESFASFSDSGGNTIVIDAEGE